MQLLVPPPESVLATGPEPGFVSQCRELPASLAAQACDQVTVTATVVLPPRSNFQQTSSPWPHCHCAELLGLEKLVSRRSLCLSHRPHGSLCSKEDTEWMLMDERWLQRQSAMEGHLGTSGVAAEVAEEVGTAQVVQRCSWT